MTRLLAILCLLLCPTLAWGQTTWSINPTTGTVILDNVTITDTLMELGVTVDLQLDKQATGGAAQCLQVGSTGLVTKTGSACGGTGSSPGGANTNVQYNASGTFAGDTSFTFTSGSKLVTVFDLLITDQATGGANQGLQIDTAGNVTKTGGIPAIPSGALTNHAVLAGRGTTSFGPLSLLTNGQFLIGSTGADPVAATITTSSLTAASGAGTFSLDTPTITSGQLVKGGGSGPYTGLNITGLVLAQGAGAAIVYPGSTCPGGQFATGASASGVLSCSTPTGSGNVNAGGTLTANQIVIGQGSTNVATLGTLGTATTVLHGNAGGAPTFSAVNLSTDVVNILAVGNGGTGLASGTTGGVLYFTAGATLASSGQLVNHAVVVGGGAVSAPHSIASTPTLGMVLTAQGAGADPIWTSGGAVAAAGSNGQIQFNSGGVLGADAGLNWDNVNKRMGLGTASPSTQLQMTGDLTATGLTWQGTTGPNPRLIMLENGAAMLGDNTVLDGWRPYMRLIENDVNNAQKTQIYIENVNTQIPLSVTSLSRNGSGTGSATTAGNHNYQTGYTVKITGASPGAYNGEYTITVTGLTTFTFSLAGGPDSASGTIFAQQAQINSGIAIFHYSPQDNGHEVSGIVSTESGAGNAATFQRLAATPLDGLPMVTLSRQFGFAIEFNCNGNTTCMIGGNSDNGLSAAHGVGSLAGPPWPEGIRIYPVANALNLDQRVAIRVTASPDNLNDTTNDVFKVMLNGGTLIQSNSGISNHLTIEGLGANGANIRLIGNGGGADTKTLRVAGGLFQMLDSAYTNVLFQMNDAGTSPAFPQLTGAGNVSLCISATGVIFRGSPGC